MLRQLVVGDDPRDLRQPVGGDVLAELGDQVVAVAVLGVGLGGARRPGPAALVEHRVRADAPEIAEIGEAVVAVVLVLLIDLPGDARRLQALGIGRPRQALEPGRVLGRVGIVVGLFRRVGDDDAAVVAGRQTAGAAEQEQTVRIGRAEDRAVIGVADREGVGERVVEGQVRAGEVAHGQRGLGRDPGVVVLPARVAALPAVVQVAHGLGPRRAGVEMEGADGGVRACAPRIRLLPDALARRQGQGARIAVAAHAAQGPEIVVEAAVLLHQDHHVLHVLDGAGDVGRRQGQRLANPGRQGRGPRCAAHRAHRQLQEFPALVPPTSHHSLRSSVRSKV